MTPLRAPRLLPVFLQGVLLVALVSPAVQAKEEWLPITPEEWALKDSPASPGAHAILLYRQVETDDVEGFERHYYRIKILTEQGKKYADVEIRYLKDYFWLKDVRARTVRPDGSVVEFAGQLFEKVIWKRKGVQVLAKTFTLPEVQVGSIIEYKYTMGWDRARYYAPVWEVQHNLFTRRARFQMRPYLEGTAGLRWTSFLPKGMDVQINDKDKTVGLVAENVAAFEKESYMPPERTVRSRVSFYYTRQETETPDEFWKREGKEWHEFAEQFIGNRKGVRQAVEQLVDPADPPETKLRKLYARSQQIRNLTFERLKTEKEQEREKRKDNQHVEDVWKNGYGYRTEITRLFVGLARAAGLSAAPVRIAERDEYFLQKNLLDPGQLNGEVAWVQAGAQEYYLDPGTPYCPFGLLSWEKSGVSGIRLAKEGGAFVITPQPTSLQALVERKATLRLDEEGGLEGKLEIVYSGQEALEQRLQAMDEDEAGRRKRVEDEVKSWSPGGAEVTLESVGPWENAEEPLRAVFAVRMPLVAASAGNRLLLPVAVFHTNEANIFQHAARKHPVYFRYPFRQVDEVVVELPSGLAVETLPTARNRESTFGRFTLSAEKQGSALRLGREMEVRGFYFSVDQYPYLRGFFDTVRAGDGDQAILQQMPLGQRQ